MTNRILCTIACALLSFLPQARAQHGAANDTTPSFCRRETLTNDWFGGGPAMKQRGIFLSSSLAQFYQGMAGGEGNRDWEYSGKWDIFLRLDGSKLGLWKGFGISAHGELNYGHGLGFAGGAILPSNLAMLLPGSGDEAIGDLSLYGMQQFGKNVTLLLGKINMVDIYDAGKEFSGGRGVEQFLHVELCAPVSGITPPMIFGGILSVKTKPAKITLMVYDPSNYTRKTGLEDPFAKGVTFNSSVEVASHFFGKAGKHSLSPAFSTQNGADLADFPELSIPNAPAGNRHNRWYIGYAFEQTLWRDTTAGKQGWGIFGQASISDANPNAIGWSALAGVGGSSPIKARPRDKFGVGVFALGLSKHIKEGLSPAIEVRNETGLEVFYNFAATPWFRITADGQFILPMRADRELAVVAGLRAQIIL